MKKSAKITLGVGCALALLVCVPMLVNLLGSAAVYAAKRGRVVDVTTGKGMPGVFVIATGDAYGQVFNPVSSGGFDDPLYRIVARTDANGDYTIPSTWAHAEIWFPPIPFLLKLQAEWKITAFLPGYAVVGDEVAWRSFDDRGHPSYSPRSLHRRTGTTLGLLVNEVEPLEMRPVQLNLREAATYYASVTRDTAIGRSGRRLDRGDTPEENALREIGRRALLPQLCSMDSLAQVDAHTVNGILRFSPSVVSREKYHQRLVELEPQNNTYRDSPKFLAGHVCEAMKLAEGTQ